MVTNITSSSGGDNGGSVNTLFGSGFSPNKEQNQVRICNKDATIINSTFSQITFFMPSCNVPGNHSFFVSVGGLNDSSIYYNYTSISTPKIYSISPASSNPTRKTKIVINGTGFGSDKSVVSVHLVNETSKVYELKILTVNNSCIQAGLSGGLPGNYTLEVILTNGQGQAQPTVAGADHFTYEFAITSVSPQTGSFYGGTLLTLTGINFSPEPTDTLVYIGYALNWFCKIESITENNATCRTPPSHPKYLFN